MQSFVVKISADFELSRDSVRCLTLLCPEFALCTMRTNILSSSHVNGADSLSKNWLIFP